MRSCAESLDVFQNAIETAASTTLSALFVVVFAVPAESDVDAPQTPGFNVVDKVLVEVEAVGDEVGHISALPPAADVRQRFGQALDYPFRHERLAA
jgi:hypothetical protein